MLTFLGPEVINSQEFMRDDLVGQRVICYVTNYPQLIDRATMEVKIPRLNLALLFLLQFHLGKSNGLSSVNGKRSECHCCLCPLLELGIAQTTRQNVVHNLETLSTRLRIFILAMQLHIPVYR